MSLGGLLTRSRRALQRARSRRALWRALCALRGMQTSVETTTDACTSLYHQIICMYPVGACAHCVTCACAAEAAAVTNAQDPGWM